MRTICVELLRAGPPHNHLLSPLTRYLALCGDAQVGELAVPSEHAQMLRQLRALRYDNADGADPDQDAQDRQAAVIELSRQMSRLLAGVPGLAGQLGAGAGAGANPMTHLQIVTSAGELSMLPFELCGALDSGGDEPGNYLLLGGQRPLCLTRRVRSVSEASVKWPLFPKILFVWANPTRDVPHDDHHKALLAAMGAWIPPPLYPGQTEPSAANAAAYQEAVDLQLRVLDRASIDDVARACAEGDFTHVHVLAHGAPDPSSLGRQYGILLHNADDKTKAHVVSGAQFASALRREGTHGGPSIVTVAACDSGNVSDVMYTGASFVHDVHRSGVPFVLGSQFELSKAGSIDLCEGFYEGVLRGRDPRELLVDLRLRLHSVHGSSTYDWGSLLVYAVFPGHFDDQLDDLRYQQARRAANVALKHFDGAVDYLTARATEIEPKIREDGIAPLTSMVDAAAALVPTQGRYRVEGLGLLAAYRKRTAEVLFRLGSHKQSLSYLEQSLEQYGRCFREGVRYRAGDAQSLAPLHWGVTQQVAMRAVLGLGCDPGQFQTAALIANEDVGRGDRDAETWAITSLLELRLVQDWLGPGPGSLLAPMDDWTRRLLTLSEEDAGPVESTRRQLNRYLAWWWTDDFTKSLRAEYPTSKIVAVPDDLQRRVAAAVQDMGRFLRTHETSVGRRR